MIDNKEILITGIGSLGKTILKILLEEHKPKGIRLFSRGEFFQHQLKEEMKNWDTKGNVAFLIGDIRDYERLKMATKKVDIIFNTAAMKQVPACEYNPIEAIKTNVYGSENILKAALENNVETVMHVSTDKNVKPVNIYGMTKGCAEKLFIHGNVYSKFERPKFSCCRYGNVLGSRGSIIPLWKKQYEETGEITITDKRMTRFWITLNEVARFIIDKAGETRGAEIFIPKMPSMEIIDMAKTLFPDAKIKEIGIRPGEKLHEELISKEELRKTTGLGDYYLISNGNALEPINKEYRSDNNDEWLNPHELKKLIEWEI
jgi:FlaA1/EpsC-like NDP-sugar epimerase